MTDISKTMNHIKNQILKNNFYYYNFNNYNNNNNHASVHARGKREKKYQGNTESII